MTGKRSGRPGAEPEATESTSPRLTLAELDARAERVDGAFVLLVRLNPANRPAALPEAHEPPKYRRRVFMSAAAAERAVRAAVARGESSRVYWPS